MLIRRPAGRFQSHSGSCALRGLGPRLAHPKHRGNLHQVLLNLTNQGDPHAETRQPMPPTSLRHGGNRVSPECDHRLLSRSSQLAETLAPPADRNLGLPRIILPHIVIASVSEAISSSRLLRLPRRGLLAMTVTSYHYIL